jgi:hypothetical protein
MALNWLGTRKVGGATMPAATPPHALEGENRDTEEVEEPTDTMDPAGEVTCSPPCTCIGDAVAPGPRGTRTPLRLLPADPTLVKEPGLVE